MKIRHYILPLVAVGAIAIGAVTATFPHAEVSEASKQDGIALVVKKAGRTLEVYQHGELTKTYLADFGRNCHDMRDKTDVDDTCAPEGVYKILERLGRNRTRRYKELRLDYPTTDDLLEGASVGKIGWRDFVRDTYYRIRRGHPAYDTQIGGPFGIQGYGGTGEDWTDGYVAISNDAIDKLFPIVKKGTTVSIVK
jgi:hypothetical protein